MLAHATATRCSIFKNVRRSCAAPHRSKRHDIDALSPMAPNPRSYLFTSFGRGTKQCGVALGREPDRTRTDAAASMNRAKEQRDKAMRRSIAWQSYVTRKPHHASLVHATSTLEAHRITLRLDQQHASALGSVIAQIDRLAIKLFRITMAGCWPSLRPN